MPTISFYVRHILRDEKKIEELLEALENPEVGYQVSEEDVRKTREDLERGRLFLRQWVEQYLLNAEEGAPNG